MTAPRAGALTAQEAGRERTDRGRSATGRQHSGLGWLPWMLLLSRAVVIAVVVVFVINVSSDDSDDSDDSAARQEPSGVEFRVAATKR